MNNPVFYVASLDANGNVNGYVAAQYLLINGNPVVDPAGGVGSQLAQYNDANGDGRISGAVANPSNWLIVPANYSLSEAQAFAGQVSTTMSGSETGLSEALGMMTGAFVQGGSQDLQRGSQWGIPAGGVVPAFTDSASFNLGYITGLSGIPETMSEIGGGTENTINSWWQGIKQTLGLNSTAIDTNGAYGLTSSNEANINVGLAASDMYLQTPTSSNVTLTDSFGDLSNAAITQAAQSVSVSVGSTSGDFQSLNMSGLGTVLSAITPGTTVVASSSSPTILVGGDNASLVGMAPGDIFVDLGSGGSATTSSNAQVVDFGSSFTINNQGSGCTDGVHCDGVQVNGNDETVADDSGSAVTIDGSNDIITAGAAATVDATGNDDSITGGANDTLTANGNSDDITAGTGDTVTGTGGGDTILANSGTVDLGNTSGDWDYVQGSSLDLNLGQNAQATINGGAETVVGAAGDSAYMQNTDGAWNYVQGNGLNLGLGQDSQATINGGADALTAAAGDSAYLQNTGASADYVDGGSATIGMAQSVVATITGASNAVTGAASDAIIDTGANDSYTLSAGSTVTEEAADATVTVNGSGVSLTMTGAADNGSLNGNSDTATLDGANGMIFTSGGGDQLTAGAGDLVFASNTNGAYDTITATGDQNGVSEPDGLGSGLYLASNAQANVSGGSDSVNLGSGDNLGLLGGSNYSVGGTGDSIEALANTTLNLWGNNNTVGLVGSGDYLGIIGGTNDQVTANNDTIDATASSSFNLTGYSDTVSLGGSGDYVGLLSGSGSTIWNDDTNDNVNLLGDVSATVVGSGGAVGLCGSDANLATSNETVNTITGAQADTVSGTGDTIYEAPDAWSNIYGGSDTIDMTVAQDYVGLFGSGYTIVGNGDRIDSATGGATDTVDGSNDAIMANNDHIVDDGSNDVTHGNYDTVTPSGGGDYASGSDDSDPDDPSGGSGGYGYYGFAGTRTGNAAGIEVIAQYDNANGYTQAAQAAQKGFTQATESADGDLATSAATLNANPIGPVWGAQTVTWAFAAGPTGGATPISGAIGAEYQATIVQALQTWAAATGLNLTEASSPGSADIQIGWGDFGTTTGGVVGYTALNQSGGLIQPGATVQLEDPDETPLIAGADGQLYYADTGVSLYQTALHEIGHALGLSETSDPNSVMYYALGSNNQTLDSTDLAEAQQAYGPGGTSAALIQAMASFGATMAPPLLVAASQSAPQMLALAAANPH